MCVTQWKRSVGKGLTLYDPSSRTLGKGQTVETVKGEMEARGDYFFLSFSERILRLREVIKPKSDRAGI